MKATATEKVETLVAVPAAVKSAITNAAKVQGQATLAAQTAQKTNLNLGKLIGKEMAKHGREAAQKALMPLFVEAYGGETKKLYAGQQLSRVIGFAFPGGRGQETKVVKRAQEQLRKGEALDMGVNDLAKLASGNFVIGKDDKIEKIRTTSGGGNRKKPEDTFKDAITEALEAYCKTANVDFGVALNQFVEVAVTMEIDDAKGISEQLPNFGA